MVLRRGALSARQAARRAGVLMDGQRISAATCTQISRETRGIWWNYRPRPPGEGRTTLCGRAAGG